MGLPRSTVVAALGAGLVAVSAGAAAAPGVRLSLVRGPGQPTAGRAVPIVVRARPATHAKIEVWIARASLRRSFPAKALSHGRYRASVVFPRQDRWTFGARTAGARVRLGSVRV